MAKSTSREQNEFSKFVDSPTRSTNAAAVEVVLGGDQSGNTGPFGVYDEIAVTYPTTTTEVYDYKLATVSLGTITVTYATSAKKDITGVVYSAV